MAADGIVTKGAAAWMGTTFALRCFDIFAVRGLSEGIPSQNKPLS